ncbi:MAG: MmgE/PrpD family protein, partial [Gammaproteobacteria bacterium]
MPDEPDAIEYFAAHIERTDFDALPESAVQAARVYFLDTLGVGLTGSAGPYTRALIESQRASGAGAEARVWGHRD